MIRRVTPDDAALICGIYNYYVLNTVVTFEEEPLKAEEMAGRIRTISATYPYLVLEEADGVAGYAYANKFRERVSYRFAAEVSVYLKNGQEGRGLGTQLLEQMLAELWKTDTHALLACIALPNERSVAIHEKFGFEKIAVFREVGFKMNRWLDIGYWELLCK